MYIYIYVWFSYTHRYVRLVVTDNNTEREGTATFGYLRLKQLESFLKQMQLVKKSPLEVPGPNHWAGGLTLEVKLMASEG